MIESAASAAIGGIRSGLQALDRDASRVARAGTVEPDQAPDRALLEARASKTQVEASVRALEAADETLGTLLDVRA